MKQSPSPQRTLVKIKTKNKKTIETFIKNTVQYLLIDRNLAAQNMFEHQTI